MQTLVKGDWWMRQKQNTAWNCHLHPSLRFSGLSNHLYDPRILGLASLGNVCHPTVLHWGTQHNFKRLWMLANFLRILANFKIISFVLHHALFVMYSQAFATLCLHSYGWMLENPYECRLTITTNALPSIRTYCDCLRKCCEHNKNMRMLGACS